MCSTDSSYMTSHSKIIHLTCLAEQLRVINKISIYGKVRKLQKYRNDNYFKYGNMTNESKICDFLFTKNTFLTEITIGYRDMQWTQFPRSELVASSP